MPDLDVVASSDRHIPLPQVARLVPVLEEGLIWRRNRLPTITVRADIVGSLQPKLPPGFRIEVGGSTEESAKGENLIKAVVPLMIVAAVLTCLFLPALYAAWFRVREPGAKPVVAA